MTRRILVTGGCGFVGPRVVRKLVGRGDTVSVVDDLSLGRPENLGEARSEVEIAQVDLRDSVATVRAVGKLRPDHVIHLAAIHFIPACNRDPKRCIEVNTAATQSLLDACAAQSIDTMLLASTAAVYAPSDVGHREDSTLGPVDIYGMTKLWMEQLGDLFHRGTGIPLGVARLFNVFGPGETNPHLIPEVVTQASRGEKLQLGNLTTKRDYVFVDDVAEAFMAMLNVVDRRGHVVCNVGREEEVDGREIVAGVAELLGRELDVETDASRVRTSDRPHLLSDSSKAHALLGWHANTDLRTGLRASLEEPSALGLTLAAAGSGSADRARG